MPFVKLDCGILNSTLWFAREAREVFITALLMAEPYEVRAPEPQLEVNSLNATGWSVPPGWYGLVPAAGVGIIHRAGVEIGAGLTALEVLGAPEVSSRSQDHDGRRLVRIDGGYIVLNFMRYRDRDYTSAERSRRYRQRVASRRSATVTHRDITQAEYRVQSTDQDRTTVTQQADSAPLRRPRHVQGSGVMAGTLHRDHTGAMHGHCPWQDEPTSTAPCVPTELHGRFLQQLGQNSDRLARFYREVATTQIDPCGDDPWKFWSAHFARAIGEVAPPPPTANERRRRAAEAIPLGVNQDDLP